MMMILSQEIFNLITWRRRKLIQRAEGDVLEVGVGTGRNFTYYQPPPVIKSLTVTDASEAMLKCARRKASEMANAHDQNDPTAG